MKFTVEFEITEKTDRHGDVSISGKAKCNGHKFTSGERVTASALRGGATVEGARQKVAANLAKMACRAVDG